jgi:hypothetical protein
MSVQSELEVIEEQLRQAELGPDPTFFDEALADDAVFVSNGGIPRSTRGKWSRPTGLGTARSSPP